MFSRLILFALALANCLAGETAHWHEKHQEALDEARRTQRPLLIHFTGSDWCPPCIRMQEEIFDSPAFLELASKHFVLSKVDFPRHSRLSPQHQLDNDKLAARYHVEGYPTIVLSSPQGRPFWMEMGAVSDTPENYFLGLEQHLKAFHQYQKLRQSAFQAAPAKQGLLLAQALSQLPDSLVLRFHNDDLERLTRLDPSDKSAYRRQLHHSAQVAKQEDELSKLFCQRDYGRIIEKVDEFLADKDAGLSPEERQTLLLRRAFACARLKAFGEALKDIDKMQAIAPQSQLGRGAERMRSLIKHQQEAFKQSLQKAETPD